MSAVTYDMVTPLVYLVMIYIRNSIIKLPNHPTHTMLASREILRGEKSHVMLAWRESLGPSLPELGFKISLVSVSHSSVGVSQVRVGDNYRRGRWRMT